MVNKKSLLAFIFCCGFLSYAIFLSNKWSGTNWDNRVLTYDASGYYLYLPTFFYDDLGKPHNYGYIINTYHPSGDELNSYPVPNGNFIMKYPAGMAFVYLPAFGIAHYWAKHAGYPVDGFSHPYQFSIMMEGLFVAFIGIWFMRKILLRYFEDMIVGLALICLCAGTNYLNYSTFSSALTHGYLFSIYAIILCLIDDWYIKPNYKTSIALGFFMGLAALIRPTEIICVVVPLLWLVSDVSTVKARFKTIRENYLKIAVLILIAIAVGSIQLIYWKVYTGDWLYWSYKGDDGLNFLSLKIWGCFFSLEKGWFVYTPFMILGLMGFVPLYRNQKPLFWSLFIFTFLNLWIFTAWNAWQYGGSFSQRQVVQSYAVLLFPVCSFLTWAFKRKISTYITSAFILFCIWLNLVMTMQANAPWGFMESDNMTPKYFWKIFGKIKLDRLDRRFVQAHDEVPGSKVSALNFIYTGDPKKEETLNAGKRYLDEIVLKIPPQKGWYRAYMDVYISGWEFNGNIPPYIYIHLFNDSGCVRDEKYSIQRVMDGGKWSTIPIDIETPDTCTFNVLKVGMDNNTSIVPILVKNVRVGFVAK